MPSPISAHLFEIATTREEASKLSIIPGKSIGLMVYTIEETQTYMVLGTVMSGSHEAEEFITIQEFGRRQVESTCEASHQFQLLLLTPHEQLCYLMESIAKAYLERVNIDD